MKTATKTKVPLKPQKLACARDDVIWLTTRLGIWDGKLVTTGDYVQDGEAGSFYSIRPSQSPEIGLRPNDPHQLASYGKLTVYKLTGTSQIEIKHVQRTDGSEEFIPFGNRFAGDRGLRKPKLKESVADGSVLFNPDDYREGRYSLPLSRADVDAYEKASAPMKQAALAAAKENLAKPASEQVPDGTICPASSLQKLELSPVMRQYQQFKKQHPGYVLFFRMGDFYELFFEDATLANKVLGITLTTHNKAGADPVPMAGVPYHSVEQCLRKLIAAGHKAAICEVTDGNTKREVVRMATP